MIAVVVAASRLRFCAESTETSLQIPRRPPQRLEHSEEFEVCQGPGPVFDESVNMPRNVPTVPLKPAHDRRLSESLLLAQRTQ